MALALSEPPERVVSTDIVRATRILRLISCGASRGRRVDHPVEDVLGGFGAHLDPRVAVLRAVTELNQFLSIYDVICKSLRTADDFRRITYEALEDGAAAGVRYREMFFSPGFVKPTRGCSWAT